MDIKNRGVCLSLKTLQNINITDIITVLVYLQN